VLDILNPAVDRTLTFVGVTDPTPTNASGSTK
jgi:NADH-quinone oxidoreductase subunit M